MASTTRKYYHRGQLTAYRQGRYKLQFYEDGGFRKKRERPALFDLHQDLGERLDIADQHPDIVVGVGAPSWRLRVDIFDLR